MNGAGEQAAAQARAAMLSSVAHELRSPLARIIQYAELLPADAGQTGAAIAACAREQLALVDNLLELSRLELAAPEQLLAPVALHALLQQAAWQARGLAQRHQVARSWRCGAAVPALALLDGQRLARTVGKLLQHAIESGPGLVLELSLEVAPRPAPRQSSAPAGHPGLCLRLGAPAPDDAPLPLLELPHPLSGASRAGPALALGIAAQLARAMGGQLLGWPEPGRALGLLLPQVAATSEDMALPAHGALSSPFGHGRHVLLVDGREAMRDYLCELLEGAGFQVWYAADGVAACTLLDQLGAAAARSTVLAAHHGALDAWQVLAQVARRAGPAVPVLLHALSPPPRPPGVEGEFAAVLCQPLAPEMLLQVLGGEAAFIPAGRR